MWLNITFLIGFNRGEVRGIMAGPMTLKRRAKKARITAKQKAARVKNMAIARAARTKKKKKSSPEVRAGQKAKRVQIGRALMWKPMKH